MRASAMCISCMLSKKEKEIRPFPDEGKKASMEEELDRHIRKAGDVLQECIKYVCAANYIDFSAVDCVNAKTLEALPEKAAGEEIDEKEYRRLRTLF